MEWEADTAASIKARTDDLFTLLLKLFLQFPNFDKVQPMSDEEVETNRRLINSVFNADLPKMLPRYFLHSEGDFVSKNTEDMFLIYEQQVSKVSLLLFIILSFLL